jgi:hypothetical protein
MSESKLQCPFVYASGKRCSGHVVSVEAYKADVAWTPQPDGSWAASIGEPRSHYHIVCSEKGNHAGTVRADDSRMKFYFNQLPPEIRAAIVAETLVPR